MSISKKITFGILTLLVIVLIIALTVNIMFSKLQIVNENLSSNFNMLLTYDEYVISVEHMYKNALKAGLSIYSSGENNQEVRDAIKYNDLIVDNVSQVFTKIREKNDGVNKNNEVYIQAANITNDIMEKIKQFNTDIKSKLATLTTKDTITFASWLDSNYNNIYNHIEDIQKKDKENINLLMLKAHRMARNTDIFYSTVFVSLIILLILFYIITKKIVINRLNEFLKVFKDVTSGDGDLRRTIQIESTDEMGTMAKYFNAFITHVASLIRDTKLALEDNLNTNTSMAATMEELSTVFQNQNTQVSTVASAMEEMSVSSQEVKNVISNSLGYLKNAKVDTHEGVVQLSGAIDNMDDIKSKTSKLAITISELQKSSTHIGDILNVINDIADQTNLLALNAAIEAARAGDAGRGFAVVADEVRKLAERTQKATQEIEEIISSLQNESTSASKEMNDSIESVEKGVVTISKTQDVLNTLEQTINKMSDNITNLKTSLEEQNAAIAGVNDNTITMAAGIEESAKVVHDIAVSTADIKNNSQKLVKNMSFFKV